MRTDIKLRLLELAIDSFGYYPAAIVEQIEGEPRSEWKETPRTEWQDGWNEAVTKINTRPELLYIWYESLPEEKRHMYDTLLLWEDFIEVRSDKNNKFRFYANCNDLFMWGCADCEEIPDNKLAEVAALFNQKRSDILLEKWCCHQRGYQPQAPIRKQWKEQGHWDVSLDKLEKNPDDKVIEEENEHTNSLSLQ